MSRTAWILACVLCAGASSTLQAPQDLSQWLRRSPQAAWSPELSVCANYGHGGEWAVSIADDRVVVRPYPRNPDSFSALTFRLEVEDGILQGLDLGEFGGGVRWLSRDGSGEYSVFEGNPIGASKRGVDVLVATGLAHLGDREGELLTLRYAADSGRWKVVDRIDLGTAAVKVSAEPDGRMLILTIDGLMVYEGGTVRRVLESDYGGLYPNSMVRDSAGALLVGMRYVVVELEEEEEGVWRERWLAPPGCPHLERIHGPPSVECACVQEAAGAETLRGDAP